MALGRVYCFGPTFRAEKSKTRRHLTEFWMVEPEMAYADLNDVMALAEGLVVSVVERVPRQAAARADRPSNAIRPKLETVKTPFPRVSYRRGSHAVEGQGLPIEWGARLRRP
jgi:asparaginyl-tRNA synthetase